MYLSSPLIPITTTVSIYVRLSGWSSLHKIIKTFNQPDTEGTFLPKERHDGKNATGTESLLQHTKKAVYQAPYKYRSTAHDPFASRKGLEGTIKQCMDSSLAKCSRTLESVLTAYQMLAEKETLLVAYKEKPT